MNPLKTLLNLVFETTPPPDAAKTPKEEAAFEWNPDEAVAPTSARATSWKRGDAPDDSDIAASGHNLPAPQFERAPLKAPVPSLTPSEPSPLESLPSRSALAVSVAAVPPAPPAAPAPPVDKGEPKAAIAATPSAPAQPVISPVGAVPAASAFASPTTPAPAAAVPSSPLVPLSDFEDVYRKAGIKSPVHGYGVERVYRLLTSRRLVNLDRNIRRSALLTALDAAGVPASDVSQDAVLRRKALTAYEAEKALELQSLRSRNESRAEALQDTVETFTRQKQGQIERLSQGSTSAVRAQSDLEIRKRMEQERLYRSLAYFVEPLPPPVPEVRGAFSNPPATSASTSTTTRAIERFDATIEMGAPLFEDLVSPPAETAPPVQSALPAPPVPSIAPTRPAASEPAVEVVTITPEGESGTTRPIAQSGLEMALRAAAEDARAAGWGKTAIVPDSAPDAVEALRKLREAGKTENKS